MLESQTAESLLIKIKEAPHWRVTIRPGTHAEERIRTLGECWRLVETSRVSLRGSYPHLSYEHRQYGNDWVASWDEYGSRREYWRLYQSGQFLHLFSFRDDYDREKAETKAKSDAPALSNYSPSGYLDATSALWTITEIFEFAARLSQKVDFGNTVSIAIQMVDVKDRVLYVSDPARDFSRPYIATEPTVGREWTVNTQELLGGASDLSLNATEWFFERFQWTDLPRQVLANDQRRLLDRRF